MAMLFIHVTPAISPYIDNILHNSIDSPVACSLPVICAHLFDRWFGLIPVVTDAMPKAPGRSKHTGHLIKNGTTFIFYGGLDNVDDPRGEIWEYTIKTRYCNIVFFAIVFLYVVTLHDMIQFGTSVAPVKQLATLSIHSFWLNAEFGCA